MDYLNMVYNSEQSVIPHLVQLKITWDDFYISIFQSYHVKNSFKLVYNCPQVQSS